ncbi:MAG: hypothetical protein HYU28_07730 [Actinobacteria bacterium]|nr:hypothetical protein [Actinomycetota bacterium]
MALDGTPDDPVVIEHHHLDAPKHETRPRQLAWVRNEVIEIVGRVRPSVVAFKAAEATARSRDLGRAEVEGVLQEALASLELDPLRRTKRQLKSDLNFERNAKYVISVVEGIGALQGLPKNRHEAAAAALAALRNA